MRHIVAELVKDGWGRYVPRMSCLREDGSTDVLCEHTLVDFIAEAYMPDDEELDRLLDLAERDGYTPSTTDAVHYGINEKSLWCRPPEALPGHVSISNEYSGAVPGPQQFTFDQFRTVLRHWREFQKLLAREGPDKLAGRRFEVTIP